MFQSKLKSMTYAWTAIALISIAVSMYTVASGQLDDHQGGIRSLKEKFTYDDHAPLFPLTKSDIIGGTCIILGLMVAAGGGIGGGGVLLPILTLIMGFSPKHAIPLSNITVFGGALANTYLNAKKRHPLADRPLVDWDLILVMEPLTIAGALIGVFINKLLQEEVLVVMLVVLLAFTAYNTLQKAVKMYKLETAQLKMNDSSSSGSELTSMVKHSDIDHEDEAQEDLLSHMETNEDAEDIDEEQENEFLEEVDLQYNHQLSEILNAEKVPPKWNIQVLIVMFVVVLFINLMKGGGAFKSPLGIKCGSKSFWVANLLMLGWILVVSWMARRRLLHKYYEKKKCGFQYVEGDIKWDERATIVYPTICALAGFFAGMFGVGGGIVKGPLMLAMGVHPKVSSASSACSKLILLLSTCFHYWICLLTHTLCIGFYDHGLLLTYLVILFTSFTATSSFIAFGLLIPDYGIICLLIGFIATYYGQIVLYYLMNKYQRNSYIAFSIGGVVLLSAFLMTIQSVLSLAEGHHREASNGICGR